MAKFVVQNGHQMDMYSTEIGLHTHGVLPILDCITNTNWGTYVITFKKPSISFASQP